MKTFGGIPLEYASKENAEIWLQSIPYDGTSTWGKGADKGFSAFLEAAENMELYDIEMKGEVYKKGIHILPELRDFNSPENMFSRVYEKTAALLQTDTFLSFFGGEHSISIGIIKAYSEYFDDLTVLQLDAHADLRPEYNGSQYNHACAMHDASKHVNLIQVGIRSMDIEEVVHMKVEKTFFMKDLYETDIWKQKSIDQMTDEVYITLDLDVLDPSIMPATGTPEPGGLVWHQITSYLRSVFENKNVVGFDIVELAPISGLSAPNFLAAKLFYKMLSYKFLK